MTAAPTNAIYAGDVVHNRVQPVHHALRYRVFSLFAFVDELPALSKRSRLFSYNSANLVSLHDKDLGKGGPLEPYLRGIANEAGLAEEIQRFALLCYPRVLGCAFNPLTVYFGYDAADATRLVVYEVSNTFGERMTYVMPVVSDGKMLEQDCSKQLYVSPFNAVEGTYHFSVRGPGDILKLAIRLEVEGRTCMTAYFNAARKAFSDAALARELIRVGWLGAKVIGAIHLEAAKLWLKGLRLQPRPTAPRQAVSIKTNDYAEARDA
ncbi:DUF1365 domain-containing protein [Tepidamorphus sp. 3E244]|uniref:DUF1365 domain-containing protein n=1 Tax=Tepidamorphus sp. 3E244 TaxID=3385498 RepID=UPI0038FD0678